jgi:predicted phage tail protein
MASTSVQNLRVLFALGEQITSLSDIQVNGSSIADLEMAFAYTKGTTSQPHIAGFESIIREATGEFTLDESAPYRIYNVMDAENGDTADSVEVGLYLPHGCYHRFKSGNTGSANVQLQVEIAAQGNDFPILPSGKQYITFGFNGESFSPIRKSIRVVRPESIPDGQPWKIKVSRLSPPSDLPGAEGEIYVTESSVNFTTWVSTKAQTYSGTSVLAIWIEDISLINNQWPTVNAKVKGIPVFVPANTHYDVEAKFYDDSLGHAWDGSFPRQIWTDNLGYILYSILSDKLITTIATNASGTETLDVMISFGIKEADLGIYSFYKFARYCDEVVMGEARYTFNKQFVERIPRRQMLDLLLSVGNARLVRKHGLLCITWDKLLSEQELAATTLFIPENTNKGFSYSRSHLSERYTNLIVVFQDIENNNVVSSVQANSLELVLFLRQPTVGLLPSDTPKNYFLDRYGFNQTTVEIPASISYQAALRKARGLLFDALIGKEFVSFAGGFEFNSLWQGQIIRTLDTSLATAKESGRIESWTFDAGLYTLNLKLPLTLTPTSWVYVYLKDTSAIDSEQLSVSQNLLTLAPSKVQPHTSNFTIGQTSKTSSSWLFSLPAEPIDFMSFVKASEKERTWTITTIDFSDDQFSIKAKEYFPEKFAFIGESYDRNFLIQKFSALPSVTITDVVVKVKQGFSSSEFEFGITYSHILPAYIAHSLVVWYDFILQMFDGSEKQFSIPKSFSKRELLDTNETLITQTYYTTLHSTVENFATYFTTNTGIAISKEFEFTIKCKSRVTSLEGKIQPSPQTTYNDVVTIMRPIQNFNFFRE